METVEQIFLGVCTVWSAVVILVANTSRFEENADARENYAPTRKSPLKKYVGAIARHPDTGVHCDAGGISHSPGKRPETCQIRCSRHVLFQHYTQEPDTQKPHERIARRVLVTQPCSQLMS